MNLFVIYAVTHSVSFNYKAFTKKLLKKHVKCFWYNFFIKSFYFKCFLSLVLPVLRNWCCVILQTIFLYSAALDIFSTALLLAAKPLQNQISSTGYPHNSTYFAYITKRRLNDLYTASYCFQPLYCESMACP